MSSETSPPQYRLERPIDLSRPGLDNPPWREVIATTLRLWLRRHVLRVPDERAVSKPRLASLMAGIVLVVAAAAAAVALTFVHIGKAAVRPSAAGASQLGHHTSQPITAAQVTAKTNAEAAAAWVSRQVSQRVAIGCDPVMCGYLTANGFPAGQERVLQPGDSLSGDVKLVVATGTVRGQLGTELADNAPGVIAVFGSGPESVQVRVTAPNGASAYQKKMQRSLAARRRAGRALATDPGVHVRRAARRELTAGMVDPRIMVVLHRLTVSHQVHIARFADSGPGANPGTPLRVAVLGDLVVKHGRHVVSHVAGMLAALERQGAPYHPAVVRTDLPAGKVLLSIEFPAPSPS